jgi:predicted CXXCH cytochrome family protein
MPLVELCTNCHTEYSPGEPENAGLWLHGPVGTGWCVTCHEPHSSLQSDLLRSEPTAKLCGACHLREDLVAFTPEHRPRDPSDAYPPSPPTPVDGSAPPENGAAPSGPPVVQVAKDCVRCHDPHRGPDHFILRGRRQARSDPAPSIAGARSEP